MFVYKEDRNQEESVLQTMFETFQRVVTKFII